MEDQIILACNDEGQFEEYIPRMDGHTGNGRRHIGITIILVNKDRQVLSQHRKHLVFDDTWCFTADTHTLHKQDGIDETLEEAANRCMENEYGIKDPIKFLNLGHFNYFEKDGKYCENEFCFILLGQYDGIVEVNPKAGYDCKWLSKDEFLQDLEENPKKYSPWVKPAVNYLKQMFGGQFGAF